jgi:uncharacterized iron-regulated membrane protein
MTIKLIHRYISLVFAAFWLLQAVTGMVLAFRWELDDAGVAGSRAAFNAQALERRIDAINAVPGQHVGSMWAMGTSGKRYDIYYSTAGGDRTLRVDGMGTPLRDRSDTGLGNGNIYDRLTTLHVSLFAGDIGKWIIGLSGLVLLTNIGLGLKLAWPRAGMWLKALKLPPKARGPGALFVWHRSLGLWLAVPAFITITAGVLMVMEDPLTTFFKADIPSPTDSTSDAPLTVTPASAIEAALTRFPNGEISGVSMPETDAQWYRIRLRAHGEMPRMWGRSTVYVSAQTGEVLGAYDARASQPAARVMLDTLYPLHTGQIGGPVGRVIVILIGAWLLTMIGVGLNLWWARRTRMKV